MIRSAVILAMVVCAASTAAAWTRKYEFVSEQSVLRRTGGFAGVDERFNISGTMVLSVDADASTAGIDELDAKFGDGEELAAVIRLSSLAAVEVAEAEVVFETEPLPGAAFVRLVVRLADGAIAMDTSYCEPYADGFCYELDAQAVEVREVLYVDDSATGAGDGSSWDDAMNSLQDALAAVVSGQEIRVGQGIYTPDKGAGKTPGDRNAMFELRSGVAIRGGYAGVGSVNPDARDVGAYETVLSGDLAGNDGPDFANYEDNSQLVVQGAGVDETAVLDGVTISGGIGWSGPGVSLYDSDPVLLRCSIVRNKSVGREGGFGGGIANHGSSPRMVNCLVAGNFAAMMGGGIWNQGGSYPELINCTVAANECVGGGGITGYNSRPLLDGCIVWANKGGSLSGDSYDVQYSDIEGGWSEGVGNIEADPCFADVEGGDFHLMSQGGRWDAGEGLWVRDSRTSVCIDAGNPMAAIGWESFPNGGRINMGAYGQTEQASRSWFGGEPCETIIAGDINGDCKVDFRDFQFITLNWLRVEGD